jgi:hypothetical protein
VKTVSSFEFRVSGFEFRDKRNPTSANTGEVGGLYSRCKEIVKGKIVSGEQ